MERGALTHLVWELERAILLEVDADWDIVLDDRSIYVYLLMLFC